MSEFETWNAFFEGRIIESISIDDVFDTIPTGFSNECFFKPKACWETQLFWGGLYSLPKYDISGISVAEYVATLFGDETFLFQGVLCDPITVKVDVFSIDIFERFRQYLGGTETICAYNEKNGVMLNVDDGLEFTMLSYSRSFSSLGEAGIGFHAASEAFCHLGEKFRQPLLEKKRARAIIEKGIANFNIANKHQVKAYIEEYLN